MTAQPTDVSEYLLKEGTSLVLGAVTARQRNSSADMHALLDSYFADADRLGAPRDLAWALLFSAATKWVDALIECRASHHSKPVRTVISDLAMELATHG